MSECNTKIMILWCAFHEKKERNIEQITKQRRGHRCNRKRSHVSQLDFWLWLSGHRVGPIRIYRRSQFPNFWNTKHILHILELDRFSSIQFFDFQFYLEIMFTPNRLFNSILKSCMLFTGSIFWFPTQLKSFSPLLSAYIFGDSVCAIIHQSNFKFVSWPELRKEDDPGLVCVSCPLKTCVKP